MEKPWEGSVWVTEFPFLEHGRLERQWENGLWKVADSRQVSAVNDDGPKGKGGAGSFREHAVSERV